jgi:LysR family glycine cleavage system transcriptional activator/LysR family transcriptional regulator of beta-lactamase
MAQTLPYLPWLRSFEAAARRRNFTIAAEELGLTQAAVSQHIKALEAALGVALFQRGRRGVELSAEGAAYLPHVQAAFARLVHTAADLFGDNRRTEVRLITPASFGALWIAPRLGAFSEAVPGVTLAISTMTTPADYAATTAELEIRFGNGSWPGFEAHRLTTELLTPVCAPALARAGWQSLPLLTVRGAREMWRDWFRMAGGGPAPAATHSFDTFVIAFEAAKGGAGVLLGSRPLIDAALAQGDLVRLSPLDLPSPNGHFLVYRAHEAQSPRLSDTVDWFIRQAGSEAGR